MSSICLYCGAESDELVPPGHTPGGPCPHRSNTDPCPTCGAVPGNACRSRTTGEDRRRPHADRTSIVEALDVLGPRDVGNVSSIVGRRRR